MSNLILSAINSSKNKDSMFENLNQLLKGRQAQDYVEVPIEVEASTWEKVDYNDRSCLEKSFYFGKQKHLRYFLNEVLKESERIFHHPKLIIENNSVFVELYTHDINDVSHLDLDLSKFMDEIFSEIQVITEL